MFRACSVNVSLKRVPLRCYSLAARVSFFKVFPKLFPQGGPPQDSFVINSNQLRREYRQIQSKEHPDVVLGSNFFNGDTSIPLENGAELINKAYTTIRNPYNRIAHFIELNHPEHLDITADETSKRLIARFQNSSPERSMEYKEMLLAVLEAHESLETADSEEQLDSLKDENDVRIEATVNDIQQSLQTKPLNWDLIMMEAIKLKYWVNIDNGIRDWEPGKPVHLTH